MLRDIYNRPLKDLRISVTDRCNFSCDHQRLLPPKRSGQRQGECAICGLQVYRWPGRGRGHCIGHRAVLLDLHAGKTHG